MRKGPRGILVPVGVGLKFSDRHAEGKGRTRCHASVLADEPNQPNTGALPTRKNLNPVADTQVLASEPNACDVATVVARLERGERNCAEAKLPYARFSGLSLRWVILDGADLRGARFDDCDLSFASLRGANLAGASFQGAVLDTTILDNACLREADLRGADFARAKLADSDLRHAVMDATTTWPNGFDPTVGGAFMLGSRAAPPQVTGTQTRILEPQSQPISGPLEYNTGDHLPVIDARGRGLTRWLGDCHAHSAAAPAMADARAANHSEEESYDDDSGLEAMLADPLTRVVESQPISRVASPPSWVNRRLLRKQRHR